MWHTWPSDPEGLDRIALIYGLRQVTREGLWIGSYQLPAAAETDVSRVHVEHLDAHIDPGRHTAINPQQVCRARRRDKVQVVRCHKATAEELDSACRAGAAPQIVDL